MNSCDRRDYIKNKNISFYQVYSFYIKSRTYGVYLVFWYFEANVLEILMLVLALEYCSRSNTLDSHLNLSDMRKYGPSPIGGEVSPSFAKLSPTSFPSMLWHPHKG